MAPIEIWSYQDISRITGFTVGTLRQYKHEGRLPIPDVVLTDVPGWFPATIRKWVQERPDIVQK